jgi:enoyl-CoA hydratase/carnithine racemase
VPGQLSLNRPKVYNAINYKMMEELEYFWEERLYDLDTVVIILSGEGDKGFCAGLDLKDNNEYIRQDIAAVSGPALAAGFDLITMADVGIFSETAQVGQPEINWALTGFQDPMWKLCGLGRAKELSLSGRIYGAQEALQIGLANYVYPIDGFMDNVMEYAIGMARSDRRTLMTIKEQSNRISGMEPEVAVRTQIYTFRNFVGAKAMRDRMLAYLKSKKNK